MLVTIFATDWRALLLLGRGARSRWLVVLPFVGNGPFGVPVPPRILVIAGREFLANLDDG
jgi:hypothetical protein